MKAQEIALSHCAQIQGGRAQGQGFCAGAAQPSLLQGKGERRTKPRSQPTRPTPTHGHRRRGRRRHQEMGPGQGPQRSAQTGALCASSLWPRCSHWSREGQAVHSC